MPSTPTALAVTTAEQHLNVAQQVQSMFAADLDDAKAGEERARAESSRVTRWAASTAAAGAPPHIREANSRLSEPVAVRGAAAQARTQAAAELMSRIRAVVESAAADAQNMGRLFGPWYGNRPDGTPAEPRTTAAN